MAAALDVFQAAQSARLDHVSAAELLAAGEIPLPGRCSMRVALRHKQASVRESKVGKYGGKSGSGGELG